MAIQHFSPALPVPAVSAAYPMAKPGYGKRSVPDQQPRTPHDFALLPARERYIAGFVDHLPDGAAMSVKQLTKQLPLYGQQAIGTSLNALSVAGHLRRVRCPVGTGDETRWAFRTFWSRTARDNAWWTTYLTTETAVRTAAPAAVPQQRTAPEPTSPAPEAPTPEAPTPATTPAAPAAPTASSAPTAPTVGTAETAGSAGAAGMARSAGTAGMAGTAPKALPAAFSPASRFSPAYLALAELGRKDPRLTLSAHDCTTLEPQAAEWLARGVTTDYLITALTAGLPTHVDCPPRFVRHRLTDKIPPHQHTPHTPPDTNTPPPTRHLLVECTDCGRPGPPQALPDGLCRPCRTTHPTNHHPPADPTQIAAVKAHMTNLRDLLKAP